MVIVNEGDGRQVDFFATQEIAEIIARRPHHRAGRDGRMALPGAESKNGSKLCSAHHLIVRYSHSSANSNGLPGSIAATRPPRPRSGLTMVVPRRCS